MSYGPSPFSPAPPNAPAPAPAGAGLHPMSLERVFGLARRLVAYRWRPLYGVALVVLGPAYLLSAVVNIAVADTLLAGAPTLEQMMTLPPEQWPAGPELPLDALLLSWLASILTILASLVAGAALVHMLGAIYGGGETAVGASVTAAFRRLGSVLGSYLLVLITLFAVAAVGVVVAVALAVAGGGDGGPLVLLALIAGVAAFAAALFVFVRWALLVQAIMLEGQGAIEALGRSWRLISGAGWRVLGYMLLLLLISFLLGLAIGVAAIVLAGLTGRSLLDMALQPDALSIGVQTAAAGLAAWLLAPYASAVLTLLYYDLRWRRGEFGTPAGAQFSYPYGSAPYGPPPGPPPYGGPPGSPPYGGPPGPPPYGGPPGAYGPPPGAPPYEPPPSAGPPPGGPPPADRPPDDPSPGDPPPADSPPGRS